MTAVAQFKLGAVHTTGEVVRENSKTVLVRLSDGKVIKRHKTKHQVSFMENSNG